MAKAVAAMIAAIEAYNKPDAAYREETFALLATNAWELMLKAKLLAENNNSVASLRVYEKRTLTDGRTSTRKFIKRNRCGTPQTVSLGKAMALLENKHSLPLDSAIRSNLDALIEIRDNAAHYLNAGVDLEKAVLGVGTASVANFVTLSKRWFGSSFDRYRIFLMPLSFLQPPRQVVVVATRSDEEQLVQFVRQLVSEARALPESDFFVSLEMDVSMKRKATEGAASVRVTRDPSAPAVRLTEEDIRRDWPWDYAELNKRLKARYSDFLQNKKYHDVRRTITDDRLVHVRFLDRENPSRPENLLQPEHR